ncbi:MAG: endonuclease/exonuclease/phosphatase family protein [Pirellulales bacterium]
MRRLLLLLLLAGTCAGGYYAATNYDIAFGPNGVSWKPRDPNAAPTVPGVGPPVTRSGDAIRIASFNIQVFGQTKAAKPHVMNVLADVVRRFDVVAIQEIRSLDDTVIPNFVALVNSTGRSYDYVLGKREGFTSSKEQYAYIFDTASVEVDRAGVYSVGDPDKLFQRPPLVAWFRVRGPASDRAFTFKLVNVHTDPDKADLERELDYLDDVLHAVRNEGVLDPGSDEDDVILLGDFNTDERHLGPLGRESNIAWAIAGTPTNTRGTKQYDNVVFKRWATVEFTGKSGVLDLKTEFKLTDEQALDVSDHQPIWAEFSIYEGGTGAPIAARDRQPAR